MPSIYDDFYKQSQQALTTAGELATPSPESYDRAAGRIRSRIEGRWGGQKQDLENQYSGRGLLRSGPYAQQYGKSWGDTQNAYASALGDLESQRNQDRLQAAQIQSGIGGTAGGIAGGAERNRTDAIRLAMEEALGQGRLDLEEYVAQTQAGQGEKQLLTDLYSKFAQYGIPEVPQDALGQMFMENLGKYLSALNTEFGVS